LIGIGLFVLVVGLMSGCGSRTVLISEDSPIRMGPNVQAKVYTLQQGQWILSSNQIKIPEGWYCVPPSFVNESRELVNEGKTK
jgi:uncharacterized protein YceK